MNPKKSVLGRGLEALIEDANTQRNEFSGVKNIPIDNIENNPYQPRSNFDTELLKELSESIKTLGIIQPITVRKINNNKFQLISGERRLRASKMAEITEIPAYIREVNDNELLELALVENIQREDLDPIEIALSYKRLIEECSLTHEKLSERVGKQRTTISNFLRLLKLPPEIQLGLKQKNITTGHARSLININDEDTQIMIFHQILKYDFSVRKVEDIVRELNETNQKYNSRKNKHSSEFKQLCEKVTKKIKCKVNIKKNADGNNKIILTTNNEEDFNKIIKKLLS